MEEVEKATEVTNTVTPLWGDQKNKLLEITHSAPTARKADITHSNAE